MRSVFISVSIALSALIFAFSCTKEITEEEKKAYLKEHAEWQQKRIENLKAPDGYVNLAGLYWLKSGMNTLGSDPSNQVVFPQKAPGFLGKLLVTNTQSVLYEAPTDAEVLMKNPDSDSTWQAADLSLVFDDSMKVAHQMTYQSLTWYVIKRGAEIGVRLRDFEHPALDSLQSIDYFPTDLNWRLVADFEPYDPPKILKIQNIVGITYEQPSPGRLVFRKEGVEYTLDVTEEGDKFFVTYADETTGETTYGGGRYMYTLKPDSDGKVVMDFNKGYNPPCVYTEFATCPLPPPQNKLKVAILAGEKFSGHY